MDRKAFLIAAVAVFVVYQILNFLVVLLALDSSPDADMMSKMWIMWRAAVVFVYLFHVRQGPGVMEGVRYGHRSLRHGPDYNSMRSDCPLFGTHLVRVWNAAGQLSLVYNEKAPQEASQASTPDTAA